MLRKVNASLRIDAQPGSIVLPGRIGRRGSISQERLIARKVNNEAASHRLSSSQKLA
jgi:hypothetical protein